MYVSECGSKVTPDFPENISSTAIGLTGTTQFLQAFNGNYTGYMMYDVRARVKKILQVQMFLFYQIMFIIFCLSHPIESKLLPKYFWNFTPQCFSPDTDEIDLYINHPKFLWRFSMGNYGYFCDVFAKHLPFLRLEYDVSFAMPTTYNFDDSPLIPFIQTGGEIIKSTFKTKLKMIKNVGAHHIKFDKIKYLHSKFTHKVSIYEQSEIFHSDDVQLHLLDSKFTYDDFINEIITGYTSKGPGKLLLEQINEYNKRVTDSKYQKKSDKEVKKSLKKSVKEEKKAFKEAEKLQKKLKKQNQKLSKKSSSMKSENNLELVPSNEPTFSKNSTMKFAKTSKLPGSNDKSHFTFRKLKNKTISIDTTVDETVTTEFYVDALEHIPSDENKNLASDTTRPSQDIEVSVHFVHHLETPKSPAYYLGNFGDYNKQTRINHFQDFVRMRKEECPVLNELYVNSKWCHQALLNNYTNLFYAAAIEYFGANASVNSTLKNTDNGRGIRVGWTLPGNEADKSRFMECYQAAYSIRFPSHGRNVPCMQSYVDGKIVLESFFSVLPEPVIYTNLNSIAHSPTSPIVSLPPTIRPSNVFGNLLHSNDQHLSDNNDLNISKNPNPECSNSYKCASILNNNNNNNNIVVDSFDENKNPWLQYNKNLVFENFSNTTPLKPLSDDIRPGSLTDMHNNKSKNVTTPKFANSNDSIHTTLSSCSDDIKRIGNMSKLSVKKNELNNNFTALVSSSADPFNLKEISYNAKASNINSSNIYGAEGSAGLIAEKGCDCSSGASTLTSYKDNPQHISPARASMTIQNKYPTYNQITLPVSENNISNSSPMIATQFTDKTSDKLFPLSVHYNNKKLPENAVYSYLDDKKCFENNNSQKKEEVTVNSLISNHNNCITGDQIETDKNPTSVNQSIANCESKENFYFSLDAVNHKDCKHFMKENSKDVIINDNHVRCFTDKANATASPNFYACPNGQIDISMAQFNELNIDMNSCNIDLTASIESNNKINSNSDFCDHKDTKDDFERSSATGISLRHIDTNQTVSDYNNDDNAAIPSYRNGTAGYSSVLNCYVDNGDNLAAAADNSLMFDCCSKVNLFSRSFNKKNDIGAQCDKKPGSHLAELFINDNSVQLNNNSTSHYIINPNPVSPNNNSSAITNKTSINNVSIDLSSNVTDELKCDNKNTNADNLVLLDVKEGLNEKFNVVPIGDVCDGTDVTDHLQKNVYKFSVNLHSNTAKSNLHIAYDINHDSNIDNIPSDKNILAENVNDCQHNVNHGFDNTSDTNDNDISENVSAEALVNDFLKCDNFFDPVNNIVKTTADIDNDKVPAENNEASVTCADDPVEVVNETAQESSNMNLTCNSERVNVLIESNNTDTKQITSEPDSGKENTDNDDGEMDTKVDSKMEAKAKAKALKKAQKKKEIEAQFPYYVEFSDTSSEATEPLVTPQKSLYFYVYEGHWKLDSIGLLDNLEEYFLTVANSWSCFTNNFKTCSLTWLNLKLDENVGYCFHREKEVTDYMLLEFLRKECEKIVKIFRDKKGELVVQKTMFYDAIRSCCRRLILKQEKYQLHHEITEYQACPELLDHLLNDDYYFGSEFEGMSSDQVLQALIKLDSFYDFAKESEFKFVCEKNEKYESDGW